MTGRILSFVKSPHQSAQELLPWFLNGTLDAEESAQVEQHLHTCAACRSELQCLRELQLAYVQDDSAPGAEAALNRLLPQLQPGAAPAARPGFGLPAFAFGASEGKRALGGMFPGWTRIALAAQFGVIFALGWAVLQPDRTASQFHVLAAAGAPAHARGEVAIVFDPAAPQREVERILRRVDARVVDGPTASNGFVLAVPEGQLQSALSSLRSEPLVRLAAPLEATRSP
jgi:anti-sigma factor RsiW